MMKRLVLAMLAAFSLADTPLAQQDPAEPVPTAQPAAPLCTAEHEGSLSCQAGRSCRCSYLAAVPARGLAARWAWDCDIKRPACAIEPAGPGASQIVPPDAVIIDRRRPDRGGRGGE